MFTNTTLTELRKALMTKVDHAQYVVGQETKDAQLEHEAMLEDGKVVFDFSIDAAAHSGKTISTVRLCGADGSILAEKNENILCDANLGHVFYRFYAVITEV